jgi:hypothetical protein
MVAGRACECAQRMLLCFSDVAEVPSSALFLDILALFISVRSRVRTRKKPRKKSGAFIFLWCEFA